MRSSIPVLGLVTLLLCPISAVGQPQGNRSWRLTAEIDRASSDQQGVFAAVGTINCGLTFYLKDQHLVFDYNWFGEHTKLVSTEEVPLGEVVVGVRFTRVDTRGEVVLTIGDREVGTATVPRILRMISSTGLDIGRDGLSGVTDDYAAPFEFTGSIARVVFELVPRAPRREDRELEARVELARE